MALICLLNDRIIAQPAFLDSILRQYPFINSAANILQNDSTSLTRFFEKLDNLEKEKQGKVNVVQIGDSHIQADFFSGTVRKTLQREFGNGGRGLIFPYRVAKTNGPSDYLTFTNTLWESKRNVFPEQPLPIGVSGITIKVNDSDAALTIVLKDKSGMDYSVSQMTLFHSKVPGNFDFAIFDSSGKEIGYIVNNAPGENKFTSSIRFKRPVSHFTLKCCGGESATACAQIYGILLENDSAGIVYNMIGVNGAQFEHYLKSRYFIQQLPALHPDLVILSLGTNESHKNDFDTAEFRQHIDSLMTRIRAAIPEVDFLVTIPGDSYRISKKGKKRIYVKNPTVLKVRETLIQYCRENNLAWWDLLEVMGGHNSMGQWYKAGMADKARLHFSAKGYRIQGELLNKALLTSYREHKQREKRHLEGTDQKE